MMYDRAWSVSQLTKYIKNMIDNDWQLHEIWIKGEISNFTHHSSGHMYFSIKDEKSVIRSIMFAGNNRFLVFQPKNGMRVLVKGYVSIFERDGQYQLYIQEMQLDGIGNLYIAYQQMKERLAKEGLFDQQCKKPIPYLPKGIAVVTSPTGAAVRDILTTLKRRNPAIPVYVVPVSVQGQAAAGEIVKALSLIDRQCQDIVDVIILARGGGSLEELWTFNEEPVARAIFACSIPVITGVGHETDMTIVDYVADVRAVTPTGAAELAAPDLLNLHRQVSSIEQRMTISIKRMLQKAKERLAYIAQSKVLMQPEYLFSTNRQLLDYYQRIIEHQVLQKMQIYQKQLSHKERQLIRYSPQERLLQGKHRYQAFVNRLAQAADKRLTSANGQFHLLNQRLDGLSPLKIMDRGYSLAYRSEKQLITSIEQVEIEDNLQIQLQDGVLDCQVWGKKDGKKNGTAVL